MALETVVVRFSAQDFIDDPSLFDTLTLAWKTKSWFMVFGEDPVGAVLATVGDNGLTLHYKRKVEVPDPSKHP